MWQEGINNQDFLTFIEKVAFNLIIVKNIHTSQLHRSYVKIYIKQSGYRDIYIAF